MEMIGREHGVSRRRGGRSGGGWSTLGRMDRKVDDGLFGRGECCAHDVVRMIGTAAGTDRSSAN